MAFTVGNYVPSAVKVSLFGVSVDMFDTESMARITRAQDTTTFKRGMDGSATAVLDSTAPYTVSIFLQQTSGANSWFHLIYKLYERFGVEFKMPLSITDESGDTRFFCTDVFFENEPDTNLNGTLVPVEWRFGCFAPSFTKGGNVPTNQLIETMQLLTTALSLADMAGINLDSFSRFTEGAIKSTTALLKDRF